MVNLAKVEGLITFNCDACPMRFKLVTDATGAVEYFHKDITMLHDGAKIKSTVPVVHELFL